MKFAKGVFIGSLLTAGVIMMCHDNEMMNMTPKKMTKKGKQFAKKMGIL
ncbi:MAG: YtxH domain-containing protein [Clostridia bacterium]|nr:YtxH domain-containing protein [Clostridia bacterium]